MNKLKTFYTHMLIVILIILIVALVGIFGVKGLDIKKDVPPSEEVTKALYLHL